MNSRWFGERENRSPRRSWRAFQTCTLSISGPGGLAICNFLAGVLYIFDYGKKGVLNGEGRIGFFRGREETGLSR